MSNKAVDRLAREFIARGDVPAEAAYFAGVVIKFLEEAEDAVTVWEARHSGQGSLADDYGDVAGAVKILRSVSKDLDKVVKLLS